jgi:hypothetical protein
MTNLEARVLYDFASGRGEMDTATLYLGRMSSVNSATAALRSAADEVHHRGGTRMRVEFRNDTGTVVLAANLRD